MQFGQDEIMTFDGRLSLVEKWSAYYTFEEYTMLKSSAFRLARDFKECGILSIDDSVRGLEKFTSVDRPKMIKRKRNVIQSAIQVHQMDNATHLDERTQGIQQTLKSYVSKNVAQAAQKALKTAKSDAAVATKIYKEHTRAQQDKADKQIRSPVFRQKSLAAVSA